MSPWWDRDDEDEEQPEISKAWYAKHGTLAVPPESVKQAWQEGRTGLEPDRRATRSEQSRRTRLHAENVHPITGRFAASWKPMPRGGGMRAQILSRFRPGHEYARRAGRKRSWYKTQAARANGRLGGLSRSPRKVAAARVNGRLGWPADALRSVPWSASAPPSERSHDPRPLRPSPAELAAAYAQEREQRHAAAIEQQRHELALVERERLLAALRVPVRLPRLPLVPAAGGQCQGCGAKLEARHRAQHAVERASVGRWRCVDWCLGL